MEGLDFAVLARIEENMNTTKHEPVNKNARTYGRDAVQLAREIVWDNAYLGTVGNPDLAMGGTIKNAR